MAEGIRWRLHWRPNRRVLLIGGSVLTLLCAVIVVTASPVLGARHFVVEGVKTIPLVEVSKKASVKRNTPLARVDTAAIARRVQTIPAVATAEVFRVWPNTIRVVVIERRPIATAKQGNRFAIVDDQGVVFRHESKRPELPMVELNRISPADPTTRAVLVVAEALNPPLRQVLVKITAPTADQVTLHVQRGRVIFWGDSSNNVRKAAAATALLDKKGNYLDVSSPKIVTVR